MKPLIRQASAKEGNYLGVAGLLDLNYYQKTHAYYKTGMGLELTTHLNNKWYARLAAVQGFSNMDDQFAPKTYLYQRPDSSHYLYTDIRSRVSYTPNHVFNFQAGVDHNFVGQGSRSMLLGDYGKPYPFGMIRARFWRIEYSVLYQFMQEGPADARKGKFGSSHHISFNPTKWLNIGVFESVIFKPSDEVTNRGFDVEYLNPLVFYRPQEYSLGSSDNVIMGLDLSAKWKEHMFYGQIVFDEFYLAEIRARSGWWANKFGGQIGFKGRFGTNNNWFYRLEYNFSRPYTFSHIADDVNYGNQGTPLAHPYGANFMEILGEVKWQKDRWLAKAFTNYVLTGDNKDGFNQGTNIYESYTWRPDEYNHFIGQGIQRNMFNAVLTGSFMFLKDGRMSAFCENHFRYNAQDDKLNYRIVVGIRSMLWNDHRNY